MTWYIVPIIIIREPVALIADNAHCVGNGGIGIKPWLLGTSGSGSQPSS